MNEGIGDFLRSRRERLRPEDVGLSSDIGRRRGRGLRREDVAALANVSMDYYTRLEQGRTGTVSAGVLDAVARALRLDDAERQHLDHLAIPRDRDGERALDDGQEYEELLAALVGVPALVLDPAMDVLGTNSLAARLFGLPQGGAGPVNLARLAFSGSGPRARVRDADAVGLAVVAHLRFQNGRRPGDPLLTGLIDELTTSSEEFRSLWAQQSVRFGTSLVIEFDHPDVGLMRLTNHWLAAPTDPDVMLVLYVTEPGSASERHLAALAASIADAAPARMRNTSDAATMPRSTAAL